MKRFVAILLAVLCVTTTPIKALALDTDTSDKRSIQNISDSQKHIIQYDNTESIEYAADIIEDDETRTCILDDGIFVYKTSVKKSSGAMEMFRKPSGSLNSEYVLYSELTEEDIAAQNYSVMPYRTIKEYRHGTCFEFDYYSWDDGSHSLFINHDAAEAPPNKFATQVKNFKNYSVDADADVGSIILDLFGLIPGASIPVACAQIIYDGAVAGDKSASIASALVSYAWAVADTVLKNVSAVSILIDGYQLISDFNKVHDAWNTVKYS